MESSPDMNVWDMSNLAASLHMFPFVIFPRGVDNEIFWVSSLDSLWLLSNRLGQLKIMRVCTDMREPISSVSNVNSGQTLISGYVKWSEAAIEHGRAAKPEKSLIVSVYRDPIEPSPEAMTLKLYRWCLILY